MMPKYIYICSAGHSGSTLLDLLLGSHSKLSSLGEITQLPKNLSLNTVCTCGEKLSSCKVWQKAIKKIGETLGVDLTDDPYQLNLGFIDARVVIDTSHQNWLYNLRREMTLGLRYAQLRFNIPFFKPLLGPIYEAVKNNILVYDTIRELLKTDMVVDSSKSYLKAVGLYKMSPGSTRIILLTRDGRGVFYSGLKRKFSKETSLNNWKNHYARGLPLLKKHVNPQHILQVKYENLAQDTPQELEKICRFIGIEFEKNMLNFFSKKHHLTNGNDMRFINNTDIYLDTAWKEKLTANDFDFFESKAGALNRSLGYEKK